MKLCYDGIGLSHFKNTGLCSYTFELLNRLTNLYPQAEYRLVSNSYVDASPLKIEHLDFDEINLNRKENNYEMLESYLIKNNITIYHSPNNGFSLPKRKVCKYVLTLHNLLPLSNPELVDKKYYKKFRNVVPISLEKADKVIAVSKFIKDELITYLDIPSDKISVIYPTISKMFRPIDKEKCSSVLANRYGIDGDFLLFAGSAHERKHLDIILTAFKDILEIHKDLKLIIAGNNRGKKNLYYLKLKDMAKDLNISHNIRFIGSIDYAYMPYLYNNALSTITISDYEGFPTSSLESLSCGTPVICCDTSSFKEVLEDSAIYVDYEDIEDFKNTLLETIEKKKSGLLESTSLMSKYQTNNSIKQLVRIYESII
ncbi:glycosyltransferase family 1 protein [Wukongibacter baidiensis]|uniref:glycosyltransferase family 4 protein n=1 Tax=Wukongibacter baidiensis TaxID=1723361 RepID=UPI003D7F4E89